MSGGGVSAPGDFNGDFRGDFREDEDCRGRRVTFRSTEPSLSESSDESSLSLSLSSSSSGTSRTCCAGGAGWAYSGGEHVMSL